MAGTPLKSKHDGDTALQSVTILCGRSILGESRVQFQVPCGMAAGNIGLGESSFPCGS